MTTASPGHAAVELGHLVVGEGPTLVALHGGLLGGRLTFGPVLADWARHLRVLVPDRRGYELTPGPGGSIAAQARDLEAFIDTRAGGRAHVLGFSFGGVVALTALQLARHAFASLTVVEAPAVTLCGRDPRALALRASLRDLHADAVARADGERDGRPGDGVGGRAGEAAVRELFALLDPRALGRIDALRAARDPGLHVAIDELAVWRTPLSPVGLAGAAVPVLVVTGARSPRPMHAIGRRVAAATGGTHHVLASAGHAAHLAGPPFHDLLLAHIAGAGT